MYLRNPIQSQTYIAFFLNDRNSFIGSRHAKYKNVYIYCTRSNMNI